MDMFKIEGALKGYGLSDKEARLYIICLKIGSSTVVSISKESKMRKSTCYDLLNSLIEKSLVSLIIKKSTRYYEAADPKVFLTLLENKKTQLEHVLPILNVMKNSVEQKPDVFFYEGVGSIKSIFADIIGQKKELRVFANNSNYYEIMPHFTQKFIRDRKENNIFCKNLGEDSLQTKKIQKLDEEEFRKTKIHPLMNNKNVECYIYGSKIAFLVISKNEPVGVIVDNEDIANLQRAIFDGLWDELK
ncbi:MAG: hypothetical protein KAI55_00230 [Candidatus Aenigmarchaeota archaeon]|nr:hypothetical protein [Candidatus Aenigmarchaeota archaeon]